MCEDRNRLLEDRRALQDAIMRALALDDEEEVNRLTRHLEWLNNFLKNNEKKIDIISKGERKCTEKF